MIGGTTYEEAKEISLAYHGKVILGGTYIHNMKSFLADVSQIQMIKGEMQRFEIES